jgi:hypothetical protein
MKTKTLTEEFALAIAKFNPTPEQDGVVFQTAAGALWCRVYEDNTLVPWVAARFLDTKKACQVFGIPEGSVYGHTRLNGYCGKWNWHAHEFHPYRQRMLKKDKREAGLKMIAAFVKAVENMQGEGAK